MVCHARVRLRTLARCSVGQDVSVRTGVEFSWLTPRRRWQLAGVLLNVVALVFILFCVWLPGAGFQAAAVICYAVGLVKFTDE